MIANLGNWLESSSYPNSLIAEVLDCKIVVCDPYLLLRSLSAKYPLGK